MHKWLLTLKRWACWPDITGQHGTCSLPGGQELVSEHLSHEQKDPPFFTTNRMPSSAVSSFPNIYFTYLAALSLSCGVWDLSCGIYFPELGSNLVPLYWELGVLATGPPGKSLFLPFSWKISLTLAKAPGCFEAYYLALLVGVMPMFLTLMQKFSSFGNLNMNALWESCSRFQGSI